MALGLVDGLSQVGRELAVPEAGFVGCDLHGDGEESVVVAVDVGLYEGLELAAAGHSGSWKEKSHPNAARVGRGRIGASPCYTNRAQVMLRREGHGAPFVVYV